MLMHKVMNKQLLYHLYYGHNLCFHIPMQYSHLRGMSTKQQYRSYLPKTDYTIKRYWNCLSNISVLMMLIKLYYDLETCGIIIVCLFLLLFFYQIATHQGHFIVLGHYINNIHPGKKHNRAIITTT
jgi:hypothetical protein